MRDLAHRTANRAQTLHQALRAGHIHSSEEEIRQMERELPYEVAVVVPSWKQSIARPLAKMGNWPGLLVNTHLSFGRAGHRDRQGTDNS